MLTEGGASACVGGIAVPLPPIVRGQVKDYLDEKGVLCDDEWWARKRRKPSRRPNLGGQLGSSGLVPAIVQDVQSGEVLMLAYMNRQALLLCLETGETHFWSRSRQICGTRRDFRNTQRIEASGTIGWRTLLIQVHPRGPACHTGRAVVSFADDLDVIC